MRHDDRLDAEHDNLQESLGWLSATPGIDSLNVTVLAKVGPDEAGRRCLEVCARLGRDVVEPGAWSGDTRCGGVGAAGGEERQQPDGKEVRACHESTLC